jgi:tetratricopeptide (TPR) repeat protein
MITKDSRFLIVLVCFLLAVATLAVYFQVIGFGFINFDDPTYVSNNRMIKQGISLEGINWAFSAFYASNWHPLTWILHMFDVEFFGLRPGMHHLTNVVFHIINAILLFLVLERMTGAIWKSAAVAALFALHPLHVESVAWVSERKDVLSTFFWMLTMMGYFWYVKSRTVSRYLIVVLFYILGIFSKPMLVTLPFVLLLLDFWPLKRLYPFQTNSTDDIHAGEGSRWSGLSVIILEKIPLIVLALISSGITICAQGSGGAVVSREFLPMSIRISNAITSYIAYLGKMIWPLNLAIFYPYPESVSTLWTVLSTFFLLLISIAATLVVKKYPYLFVGWFWYLGTLVPVIGIIQVGSQSMADRYTYIPLIGVFIMIVWGLADLFERLRHGEAVLGVISTAVFALLMVATWVQVGFWKNNETLFRHALQVTKNNAIAHINLGLALFDNGDVDGAIRNYRDGLRISPFNPKAYVNLGEALVEHKEPASAIENYLNALKIDPQNAGAHTGLATVLAGMGNTDEAIRHFNEALRVDPHNIEAHNNLGNLMLHKGNLDEAIRHYTEAISINPHQAEAYNNLGTAYMHKGNLKKAIENYQEAVREMPDYAEARENLNNARINLRILEGQIAKIQELIKADPQNPALHTKFGDILRKQGEYDEAVANYRKAISIQPKYIQAMYGLVIVYSSSQEYAKALDVLQHIRQIQPGNSEVYYNIACIYAKQNMTNESISWLKQAIEKGFNNWDLIKKDPDLNNIRNMAYVNELMKGHNKVH